MKSKSEVGGNASGPAKGPLYQSYGTSSRDDQETTALGHEREIGKDPEQSPG